MKRSLQWFVVDLMLLGIIALYVNPASGQPLQPVTSAGGFDWAPWAILGLVALVIAGLVIWHRRNPTDEAKTLASANVALRDALSWAHAQIDRLTADAAKQPVPAATPPGDTSTPGAAETPPAAPPDPVPVIPAGPTPEQLAAVESAKATLDAVRHAAGLPPSP